MGSSDNSGRPAGERPSGASAADDRSGGAGASPDAVARDLRVNSVVVLVLICGLAGWILLSPARGLAYRVPIAGAIVTSSLVALAWSL